MAARCHLCSKVKSDTAYCSLCDHWFCGGCRGKWAARGLEALKEFVEGRRSKTCCGPVRRGRQHRFQAA